MNFGFTEEQELLRAEVRKFLDQNCALEEVRKIAEGEEQGYAKPLWDRMAELGWVGLTAPEAYGGIGLDLVTAIVVLEETGRSLHPSPLISTMVAAKAIELAGSAEQQARWLPALAEGSRIGTFAFLEDAGSHDPSAIQLRARIEGDARVLEGEKEWVADTAAADLFVVAYRSGDAPEALSLAVVERGQPGVTTDDFPTVDETKRMGRLRLDGVRLGDAEILGGEGRAAATVQRLLDIGALLVTAEAVGSADGAVELTTTFAKERVQFDSPIGRFQGVKHPLAEMHVDVESFRSLVYYAAWTIDRDQDDASRAVSRAKAYMAEVFPRIGIDCVGLHGGVGYTWEYDVQLYLKRSKWSRPAYGDADHHYERLAQLGEL